MKQFRIVIVLLVVLFAAGCKMNVAANLHPFQDPPQEKSSKPAVQCEYRNSGELL